VETSPPEGSGSIFLPLVDINVRMGQEDGDDGGMAILTNLMKGSGATPPMSTVFILFILPINIKIGILPENHLHLFHFAILSCLPEFLLH